MSYEGYSQFLCKNGHYWTEDCYMAGDDNECLICHGPVFWENMVDVTNGCYDYDPVTGEDTGKRIDGYVELEQKSVDKCDKCSSVLNETYKIPRKGRRK